MHDLARSANAEVFGTVATSRRGQVVAGVVLDVDGRRCVFSSICSCGRAPCEHAAAVALATAAFLAEFADEADAPRRRRRRPPQPRGDLPIRDEDIPF